MVFYRSFYEAIVGLPKDIQIEIYTAILDYGLNGNEPANMKPTTKGLFTLMRPIIDANTKRFENGKKGGRKPSAKLAGTIRKDGPPKNSVPKESGFESEIREMRDSDIWLESVCKEFKLKKEEALKNLDLFLEHLKRECDDKSHKNIGDAKRHFCSWLRIKRSSTTSKTHSTVQPAGTDYSFNGGFGGKDV